MANLYESMNKYFESKYGDDLDNVKKVEKKSLNESKRPVSRKAMKEAKDPSNFPVAKALNDAGIKMDGDINSPAAAKELADRVISVLEKAKKDASKSDIAQFDRAIEIVNKRKNSPALLLSTIGTFYTGYKSDAGAPERKDECVDAKPMSERMSRRSRMKESFRNSPYYHVIKKVLNGDAKAADIVYDWYWNEEAFGDFDDADEFEDYVRDDIYAMLDAADDVEEIRIVRKALGEEDWDKEDRGYDVLIVRTYDETGRSNPNNPFPFYYDITSKEEAIRKAKSHLGVHGEDPVSEKAETITKVMVIQSGKRVPGRPIEKEAIVYEADLNEDGSISEKKFDESFKRTPKFKINRRKVESLKSAPKRHKLEESKRPVSRKAMKEDLGKDIARYQRYLDWDMKHDGKISKKTQDLIDKAGLQVIKDQYGDYEVTAGHYEEACKSRKPMERMQERKNLSECDCEDCTCDGACTCTDEHSCCGEGKRSHRVVREAKKKETDLWETIYGDLTDDGTQRINPETGHPYINLGAGYNYQDQIAVDRAGNIVVKTKEERDLKAAIDIADKYKDKGVTYNIDQSKYDKRYPYWMTIEIPEEYKECFKESKLTEKRWAYTVSDSVSREFRDAVQSDDEDFERVRKAIIAVYDDIHKNTDLIDDDDYEDWVTEGVAIVDFDDEDDVNFELGNLYDFCDNAGVWIGI